MQTTQGAHGIANGHWESEESRAGWLLLLARMGVAELRTLGELARAAAQARDAKHRVRPSHSAAAEHSDSAVAAE
jgi:hypothetical protein